MKKKYLKVVFKGGTWINEYPIEQDITIECPNQHGGIGEIVFTGKSELWANNWFSCENLSIQFCDIVAIYAISLCDEDVPKLLWKYNQKDYDSLGLYSYWTIQALNIRAILDSRRNKYNV